MRLDNILHNSTQAPSHYSGTDWLDSALDNLPLTPLTNSMLPVDDSFEFLDQNGQLCRRFPPGPNRTLGYTTMSSSVHQSYGPINDPQALEAQVQAAREFRNMYVNPSQSFSTSSPSRVDPNQPDEAQSLQLTSTPRRSPHAGHVSDSPHGNHVNHSSRSHRIRPTRIPVLVHATPKRHAQMTDPDLTPQGRSSSTMYSDLLALDDEIDLLKNPSRSPSPNEQDSSHGTPVLEDSEPVTPVSVNRIIMIDFHFHLPIFEQRPRKRKAAGSDVPKTRAYKSDVGKVTISWDLLNKDLAAFKSDVITAILTHEAKSLAGFLERSEAAGIISWIGSIVHGGEFASGANKQLGQPGVFEAWLAACRLAPPHRKLTCKLTQKDPKAIANVSDFFFWLY
ncbi:hypothetical protein PGTUg99_026774 [Puccinia graminis f. sp. tritici]|uniref:Uncharacterized protein n=1 Tax=Puccinia graminis f. sp. tritici TaxID=56615 RepID=A0A5B0LS76_PUCGR|nr:hypothetical protein PGTUg99_026774 [Puccinia graminis f. sp. tritici]